MSGKDHKTNWTNIILIVWIVLMTILILWRLEVIIETQSTIESNQHIANHNQCVLLEARGKVCETLP